MHVQDDKNRWSLGPLYSVQSLRLISHFMIREYQVEVDCTEAVAFNEDDFVDERPRCVCAAPAGSCRMLYFPSWCACMRGLHSPRHAVCPLCGASSPCCCADLHVCQALSSCSHLYSPADWNDARVFLGCCTPPRFCPRQPSRNSSMFPTCIGVCRALHHAPLCALYRLSPNPAAWFEGQVWKGSMTEVFWDDDGLMTALRPRPTTWQAPDIASPASRCVYWYVYCLAAVYCLAVFAGMCTAWLQCTAWLWAQKAPGLVRAKLCRALLSCFQVD